MGSPESIYYGMKYSVPYGNRLAKAAFVYCIYSEVTLARRRFRLGWGSDYLDTPIQALGSPLEPRLWLPATRS